MAFPTIVATQTYRNDTSAGTHPVTLPGSLQVGDLLLTFLVATNPVTGPSGWVNVNVATDKGCWAWDCDNAAATTATFTTSPNSRTVAITYQIRGWYGDLTTLANAIVSSIAASGTANPPSRSQTWGSEDVLWIAGLLSAYSNWSASAAPTDYSGLVFYRSSSFQDNASYFGAATAYRELNASSEDPGAFTTSGTLSEQRGITVAIRPAAATGSLDTATKLQDEKSCTLGGTGFGASQGTGVVKLSPTNNIADAGVVTQTVTSWGATEIVFTADLPTGLVAGNTAYAFVTTDGAETFGGLAVLVADPTLRVDRTLTDTDAGTTITQDPLEVIVLTGTAGNRTVELNVTTEAAAAGVVEIDNAAYSIDEIDATRLVLMRQSDLRLGVDFATVVDRNDD